MYRSDHKRNVRGMHAARRCIAFSASGDPCRAPAVTGKVRCHVHGGKGSQGRTYGRQHGDYSKASLVRDRQTEAEIKRLDKLIRKLEREGAARELIVQAQTIRRGLLTTTQQKQADLAAAYAPLPSERERAREKAEELAYKFSYGDPRTLDAVRDRALGAMLGLGVGEAVGMTLDGWPRDSGRETWDMLGGSQFDLQPGQWAGGTASALALMESLTFRKSFDETDFMERLLEWEEDGIYSCTGTCIGMDETTKQALASYRYHGRPLAGNRHPDNFSCGSLVRIAPVAIRYWNDRFELLNAAERQSRTTHGGPAQTDACRTFADVLRDAIGGCGRQIALGARFVPGAALAEFIMEGSWRERTRETISSYDNVLNVLEAAIWSVGQTETFDEAVLIAANLGEQSGAVAALTGQLAGAIYGASSIRPSWLERLALRDSISEQADSLFAQSKASGRLRR